MSTKSDRYPARRRPFWPVALLAFVLALALVRCGGDDDDETQTGGPVTLAIAGGNLQAAYVGDPIPEPLSVRAMHPNGSPAGGVVIRFELLSGVDEGRGAAILNLVETVTGADGVATCSPTAGESPGMYRIRATAPDAPARPVTFHASVYPRPAEGRYPVCFLSVNDFHMHLEPWGPPEDPQGGLARIVWAFTRIREANDRIGVPTVILNAGDDSENTIYHDVPGLLPWLIAVWDRAGVDVWQVGNHDYHFGVPHLTESVSSAELRFTSGAKGHPMHVTFGNVDPTTMRDDLAGWDSLFEVGFDDPVSERLFEQTATVQAGAVSVGVLGVVTDKGVYTQVPGDPMFLRLIGAGNPYAEKMKFIKPDPRKSDYIADGIDSLDAEGADAVVVLSHTGLGFGDRTNLPPGYDDLIAQYGQGKKSGRAVDLLVSGHSHVQLNHAIHVPNPAGTDTAIVQALEGGLFFARVDALIDVIADDLTVLDSRLVQVNADLEEDPQTVAEVDYWREQIESERPGFFDAELTSCPVWASHRAETISGLGNLINDAFLWQAEAVGLPAETSIAIPSLYREDLWAGPVTASHAYDVLSMHRMDEEGTNPDTLAVLTIRPGLADWSALLLPGTWHRDASAVEYMLEVVHSLSEILDMIPAAGDELSVDVVQIAGVSYEVDLNAPMFQHVVPGSVRIGGQPVDPERTYRMVVVETFAQQMAYAMNFLLLGRMDGEGFVRPLIEDEATGKPYTDTGIPIWQALADYLAQIPEGEIPIENLVVTGEVVRTVQPDLAINGAEMSVENAARGETTTVTARARNLGLTPIESATVRLLVDFTPWDRTDQDDGRSDLEGLGEDYLGSLIEVGRETISIGAHPDYVDLAVPWDVPDDLPPGMYTLHARVSDFAGEGADPYTGDVYVDAFPDNDSGEQVMAYFEIR